MTPEEFAAELKKLWCRDSETQWSLEILTDLLAESSNLPGEERIAIIIATVKNLSV